MKYLKIYETSDIHGYFYPTSYGDRQQKAMGLFSCVAGFERDENTLYLDAGDILQGSAFSYYCRNKLHSPVPIAEIMNACKCDFYTIGNHDFNYGVDYLMEYIRHRDGKCICQNLCNEQGKVLFPYVIKVMPNGVRVGIVGIVTDYVNVWEKKENLEGVCITDSFTAAREAADEMRGQCDIMVCLYHGGFECNPKTGEKLSDTTENVGYRIAKELDYDILLTGHQHMSIDGQYIDSTYVAQPLEYGREYHQISVMLTDDGKKITSEKCVPHLPASKILCEQFKRYEDAVQVWLDEPCGHLSRDLQPEDKVKMALYGSPIADFFQKVQLAVSGAQLSAVGLANEIAGFCREVKNREVIATYPYPNTLVVLRINGRQLRTVMERSAEYFAISDNGEVIVSEDFLVPKVEHYNYDFYAGVQYRIDPYQPVGQRILDLFWHERPVEDTDSFTICINNYRATGAGGYSVYRECEIVQEINIEMVDLIMDYFKMHPVVEV